MLIDLYELPSCNLLAIIFATLSIDGQNVTYILTVAFYHYLIEILFFVLRCEIWFEKSIEKSGNWSLEKYGMLKWQMCRHTDRKKIQQI